MKGILCTGLLLMISTSVLAQEDSTLINIDDKSFKKTFVVKPAASVYYSTPQKYGVEGEVYLGFLYDNNVNTPHEQDIFLRSISLEGAYNRGGYTLGLAYSRLTASIGTIGLKYGLFYYSNNSYSTVMKRRKMFGPEITLHFETFELSGGVLKEIEGNSLIPTLGFGIRIGPSLYK